MDQANPTRMAPFRVPMFPSSHRCVANCLCTSSMDAISFVLGIKSSHLRSSQLKDLVYRGRVMKTSKINEDGSAAVPEENGQPNGHENGEDDGARSSRNDPKTAWVMAVYEDDAGDEQKWKRSITSQGSSEYRINNQVVTAQQYNDALEAENILIKARNFLVFQGDVEAIAAQSSQDLTRLIEQISGSLEYKAEYERLRAEEEQAAENQSFQLNRRRGINSEIKQYQEQKKEAENFQKKTDERDAAVVTQILWKLYHFQRVMDESSEQIHEHQENLKEFRRNVESYEKQLEAARKEQATVGRQVGKIEKDMKDKEKSIAEMQNNLVPIDEKIKQTTREIDASTERQESVLKQREDETANAQKAKKDLATVEKAAQQFENEWKEKLKKQGKELSDADRREYDILREQARSRCAGDQEKLNTLTRQLKSDEATVSTLKGKVEMYQAGLDKQQSELDIIRSRRDAAKATVAELTTQIDSKKKEFNKVKSERIRVNNTRTEQEDKLREVLVRLDAARAGMVQSDKEMRLKEIVSSLKRLYPGVRGRVGELCKPKQKKYDEAIITALGRDFDSVIVDTEKIGIECVRYVKEQRHPPITFIPLDGIKVSATNTAVKGIQGARLTIDTIDFDPSLERAMAYACANSIVCDTFEIAKNINYQRKIHVKAVSLEGHVVHKAGLMTGGRLPEQKGNKRRFDEHDVQNMERMVEAHKEELNKLPKASHLNQQESALSDELANLEQRLRITRAELQGFEKNLTSKKKEVTAQEISLDEWQPKYDDKASDFEKTRTQVEKFQKAISKTEDKIFEKFCHKHGFDDIRIYEEMQGNLKLEVEEKRQQFELQKGKVARTLNWTNSQLNATIKRVKDLETRLSRLQTDIEEYRSEKAQIEESMGEKEDELAALEERLAEKKAEHVDKVEKVTAAKTDAQKRSKEIDSRMKEINALETDVQKNSTAKFALLRRCKLEQVDIPLKQGSLDDVPNEDALLNSKDPDAMDIDGNDDDEMMQAALEDHGIEVDFDELDEDLKNVSGRHLRNQVRITRDANKPMCQPDEENVEDKLEANITELNATLEKLNPNMRANERLESVENRLRSTEQDFHDSRAALKAAKDSFDEVKAQRFELFNKAFTHIREQITHVYKELTRTDAYPLGGNAYLDIEEDNDTPYLSGIKYHAMPPLKRFRDMEHLSGGEKTMAALALLFAIHSYSPSPFFVLDEVDAALDNANVEKIKKYIREHAGPGMQFIVISLKTGLFQDSESLVGVYRDQDVNSSRTLTLDVSPFLLLFVVFLYGVDANGLLSSFGSMHNRTAAGWQVGGRAAPSWLGQEFRDRWMRSASACCDALEMASGKEPGGLDDCISSHLCS